MIRERASAASAKRLMRRGYSALRVDARTGLRWLLEEKADQDMRLMAKTMVVATAIALVLELMGAAAFAQVVAQGVAPGGTIGNSTGIGRGEAHSPSILTARRRPRFRRPRHQAAMAAWCNRPRRSRPSLGPRIRHRSPGRRRIGRRPLYRSAFPTTRPMICHFSTAAGAPMSSSSRIRPGSPPGVSTTKASAGSCTIVSASRTMSVMRRCR
jgi:hypothetical protein